MKHKIPQKKLFFTSEEYAARLTNTRNLMKINGLELLIVVEYEDIYYLTAHQTVGSPKLQILMIPIDPSQEMYFITRLLEISNTEYRSILRKFYAYNDSDDEINIVFQKIIENSPNYKNIGIQQKSKRISYYQLNKLSNLFLSYNYNICDASELMGQLRLIKSLEEINIIKKAGEFCSAGVFSIKKNAKPGMMETEIAAYAYKSMMKLGCEYCGYPTFVAAGSNSRIGHYTGDQTILKNNEILFIENGGCFQRYHAAMMRTFYVGNELPEELKEIESMIIEAMNLAHTIMIPNANCGIIDSQIRKVCSRRKEWICSLRIGYSIGIGFYTDWGEPELLTIEPNSNKILQENMVLHIIPWIQVPSKSWAVGLSDTIVVTSTGGKSIFTNPLSRKIHLITPT